MKRYRLTGNYGTFEITKVVEAEDEEEAEEMTGIMADLIAVGWTVVSAPDGEEWDIEELGWEPTHASVNDGSQVRVVSQWISYRTGKAHPMVMCENENGDRWDDPADQWEKIG